MNAVVTEWAYRGDDFTKSSITVPYGTGYPCLESHPFDWVCSRRSGHTGRHHAALHTGEVVAVWS